MFNELLLYWFRYLQVLWEGMDDFYFHNVGSKRISSSINARFGGEDVCGIGRMIWLINYLLMCWLVESLNSRRWSWWCCRRATHHGGIRWSGWTILIFSGKFVVERGVRGVVKSGWDFWCGGGGRDAVASAAMVVLRQYLLRMFHVKQKRRVMLTVNNAATALIPHRRVIHGVRLWDGRRCSLAS